MMKKILQITDSLARHGTETFIVNVLKNINRSEFQFDFLLFKYEIPEDYTEIVKQLGSQIYYTPSRDLGFRTYCNGLNAFLKSIQKHI